MTVAVLIFGAGGLAADIVDILARCGGMEIVGFVVDRPVMDPPNADREAPLAGVPVHYWPDLAERANGMAAVSAIGSPTRRRFIETAEAAGVRFLTLVDPSAQIFPSAAIGEGSVIGAGAIVAARSRLGRHVYLNRGATLGHHGEVGDFTSIHAAVTVGGACRIGSGVEIGIGAVIVDHIAIGSGATIGAGSVVTRDCPADVRMVGVPARVLAKT